LHRASRSRWQARRHIGAVIHEFRREIHFADSDVLAVYELFE
jgi:hypothetical protein